MITSPILMLMLLAAPYPARVLAAPPGNGGDQDPIAASRRLQERDWDAAIGVMEAAVQKSPKRADYWSELIFDLNSVGSSRQFVAECAAREALAANPGSPELLMVRARLMPPRAALDVLDELGRIPGHKDEVLDAKDMVYSSQWPPPQGVDPSYREWVGTLIARDEWRRADEIVRRGLARDPMSTQLMGLKALILAKDGRDDDALAEYKLAGYPVEQLSDYCPIWNLGDLFLVQGKPKLAIRSFGGKEPQDVPPDDGWLALAQARLLTDDVAGANAIFRGFHSISPHLLRIADLVRRGKIDESRSLGRRSIDAWGKRLSTFSVFDMPAGGLESLDRPQTTATLWLLREFLDEDSHFIIQSFCGFWPPSLPSVTDDVDPTIPVPSSKWVPELERRIVAATAGKQPGPRRKLHYALEEAERYDAAAAAIAPNVLTAGFPKAHQWSLLDAIAWSLSKRRAETAKYFAGHPERIFDAQRTVERMAEALSISRRSATPREAWPPLTKESARLRAMGPGALALVYDAIWPNSSYCAPLDDSGPFVEVAGDIGSEQDAPILIGTLAEIVEWLKKPSSGVGSAARYEQSEAAIHRALEKLTKTKNTAISRTDRLKFWLGWWGANAIRIVSGGQPTK